MHSNSCLVNNDCFIYQKHTEHSLSPLYLLSYNNVREVSTGLLLASPAIMSLLSITLSWNMPVGGVADNPKYWLVVVVLVAHYSSMRHTVTLLLVHSVPTGYLDPMEISAFVFLPSKRVPCLASASFTYDVNIFNYYNSGNGSEFRYSLRSRTCRVGLSGAATPSERTESNWGLALPDRSWPCGPNLYYCYLPGIRPLGVLTITNQ